MSENQSSKTQTPIATNKPFQISETLRGKKKERARKKYLKTLQLKPRFSKEVFRLLPFLLILMLAWDYFFTDQAAAYYTELADSVINLQQNMYLQTLAMPDDCTENFDFNQLYLSHEGESDEYRAEFFRSLGFLRFQIAMNWYINPYDSSMHNIFTKFFEHIYRDYLTYKTPFSVPPLSYCALFNTNGELLADQSPNALLYIVRGKFGDDNHRATVYWLDKERMELSHPGLFDQILELCDPAANGGRNIVPYFEELYVKDCLMLPKTIELWDQGELRKDTALYVAKRDSASDAAGSRSRSDSASNAVGSQKPGTLKVSIDLSDCDFSGYDAMELDETTRQHYPFFVPTITGASRGTNYHKMQFDELSEDFIKARTQTLTEHLNLSQQSTILWTAYTVKGAIFTHIPFNPSLVGVIAVDYDFFRDWREILNIAYALNLLMILLVALLWGYIRYQKKLLTYEMDAYRRKTTDAMAHDLKSPLMAISGYAENIASHTDASKTDHYASGILSAVNDMDRMIGNILDLSKLENTGFTLHPTEVSLRELFGEQLAKYEPLIQEKALKVVTEGDAVISADREQMRHLADNLLSNAVRYSSRNGKILIRLSAESLCVSNPFDYELTAEPETLLQPFVKGDSARSNTHGGGLGLSIVRQIALTHGFTVEISAKDQVFEIRIFFPHK